MDKKDRKPCRAIVLAAGQGKRMGGKVKKQYLKLAGKPVLYYSLKAFQKSALIDEMILVTGEDQIEYCRKEIVEKYGFTKVTAVIPGGSERYVSVWKGLQEIKKRGDEGGYVFIHDGVRPFVTEEMLERALEAVKKHRACVLAMPVKDTVKVADEEGFVSHTPARRLVWAIQTPQVFEFNLAYEAYAALKASGRTDATDDSMIVESFTDVQVKLVEGSYENIKLTTPEDLEIAETFRKRQE